MTPDEIRRSWDDDDTPRSVFPEPLAERLTRENKELRAEVEDEHANHMTYFRQWQLEYRRAEAAEARLDALVSDLRGLADSWREGISVDVTMGTPAADVEPLERLLKHLGVVLDKHAGEQP